MKNTSQNYNFLPKKQNGKHLQNKLITLVKCFITPFKFSLQNKRLQLVFNIRIGERY